MSTRPVPAKRSNPTRVLIVDDHPITRRGMAQLIGQERDLLLCGEAGDAEHALSALATLKPELVVVDVTLPGKPGLELLKDISAAYPDVLTLVVSMHDEALYAERALRAGARGYLMKNEGGDALIEAIRCVLSGKVYLSPAFSAKVLDNLSGRRHRGDETILGLLTDREFEVFQAVGQGLTTAQIGVQLHMSGKTVETHRLHIREKLGLKTAPELARYAVRWAGARELL